MKNPMSRRSTRSAGAALASALVLTLVAAESAHALDPRPTTYRARARHDFRDVQLGLCHPATGNGPSKSVKCSKARQQMDVKADTEQK